MFIFCILYLAQSFKIPSTQCTCEQLQSQADCVSQNSNIGCTWNGTCNTPNCVATDPTACNNIPICALQNNGSCAVFSGNCNDYNATDAIGCRSLGQICTIWNNGKCYQNTTSNFCQNYADNEAQCNNIRYTTQYSQNSGTTSRFCWGDSTACQGVQFCAYNKTSTVCHDVSCSDLDQAHCQYQFQSSSFTYYSCYYNGTSCTDAPFNQTSVFNQTTCNANTFNTYTWSTQNTICQPCNPLQSALLILSIFYILI